MRIMLAVALAASTFATPALAVTTLPLDGSPPACTSTVGGGATEVCSPDAVFVGIDYGTTANLTVDWLSASASQGGGPNFVTNPFDLGGGPADYGAVTAGTDNFDRIIFTPAAGFEVAFNSLNYFPVSVAPVEQLFQLLAPTGDVIFDSAISLAGLGSGNPAVERSLLVNSNYFAGPLTLQFRITGPNGAGVAVDDLTFDVRAIGTPPPGAVPEPSTWAMMLAGFGAIGGMMRRSGAGARLRFT